MPAALRRKAKYWIYNCVPGFAGRFPYYGTRVHFQPGAPIFRAVCENGIYEPDIVNAMVHFVRPGGTVFDVGANIGLMAIAVLSSCASCRVISFEPSPNSLPYLERTAAESRYKDRWTIIGKAISSRAGVMELAIGRDPLFDGFKSADRLSHPRVIDVQASSLDDEWRRLGCPDVSVVKADVEGAEGLVLEGAAQLIKALHPSFVVEWHEPYLKPFGTPPGLLLSFAQEFGYRIFSLPGGVPVDDAGTLFVQMTTCSNFALVHGDTLGGSFLPGLRD